MMLVIPSYPGHNNKQTPTAVESKHKEELAEEQRQTDTECSSTRSGRRHSVDTVSTYLSHESKESLQVSNGYIISYHMAPNCRLIHVIS